MLFRSTMQEKTVRNLLDGIEQSKQIPFDRVLFALGIRFVGETVAKKLARRFKNIEALQQASYEQLRDTDEVGEKIASSVQQWFALSSHQEIIHRLKNAGVQMELTSDENAPISDVLAGKTVVVSGVFQHFSRDGIKQSVEQHGGKLSGSISKKTTMVIAGESMGPEKRKKAEDLNIPIISEAEYLSMIQSSELGAL